MGAIPRWLAESAARRVVAQIARRHPGAADRLAALGARRIRFEPAELPFAFELTAPSGAPAIRIAQRGTATADTTAVRAPLSLLIELIEGRLDADAAFFSRRLAIEGDTEPVVLLRNALETEEIDLKSDIAAAFAPLEPVVLRALTLAEAAAQDGSARVRSARRWALAPLEDALIRQNARFDRLDERVAALEARTARRRGDGACAGSDR